MLKYPSLYEITVVVDDILFNVFTWQNIKVHNPIVPKSQILFQISLTCELQIPETIGLIGG